MWFHGLFRLSCSGPVSLIPRPLSPLSPGRGAREAMKSSETGPEWERQERPWSHVISWPLLSLLPKRSVIGGAREAVKSSDHTSLGERGKRGERGREINETGPEQERCDRRISWPLSHLRSHLSCTRPVSLLSRPLSPLSLWICAREAVCKRGCVLWLAERGHMSKWERPRVREAKICWFHSLSCLSCLSRPLSLISRPLSPLWPSFLWSDWLRGSAISERGQERQISNFWQQ